MILGQMANELAAKKSLEDEEKRAGTKTVGGRSLSLSPTSLSKILNERPAIQSPRLLSNSPASRYGQYNDTQHEG